MKSTGEKEPEQIGRPWADRALQIHWMDDFSREKLRETLSQLMLCYKADFTSRRVGRPAFYKKVASLAIPPVRENTNGEKEPFSTSVSL